MEMIMTVVIIAILVQAVIEGIKQALSKWDWISLALGACVCFLASVDIFVYLGVPLAVPYVGSILTGLIAGRGASAVYDIWDRLKNPSSIVMEGTLIQEDEPPDDPDNPA